MLKEIENRRISPPYGIAEQIDPYYLSSQPMGIVFRMMKVCFQPKLYLTMFAKTQNNSQVFSINFDVGIIHTLDLLQKFMENILKNEFRTEDI